MILDNLLKNISQKVELYPSTYSNAEAMNMKVNYNKLWKLMIDNGINKTQLRLQAGINTNVLVKLRKMKWCRWKYLLEFAEFLIAK